MAIATALGTAQLTNVAVAGAQALPEADILDVQFEGVQATDTARGIEPDVTGDAVIEEDGGISSEVARFDGRDDALLYDLSGQYEQIADGVSVECVFRFDGSFDGSEKSLCANKEGGGFAMVIYGDELTFTTHVGGDYKQARTRIEEGRWYHAVGVLDGTETKLYVNGDLVDTTPATGEMTLPGSNATAVTLGADSGPANRPQFLSPATLTSARIFSEPLTAAELYEQSKLDSEQRLEIAAPPRPPAPTWPRRPSSGLSTPTRRCSARTSTTPWMARPSPRET